MRLGTIKTYTEEQLVQGLQSRDQHAYTYLYDNYSRALYTIITQLVSVQELAEEVLQDAFVKIWQNIDRYDASKGRLYTWMLHIARNLSIDKLRSKEVNNRSKTGELNDAVYSSAGSSKNPVTDAGLRKVLEHLPSDNRKLIELAYFQGCTQDEISKILATPLGTIKTRMRATLNMLRKKAGVA